MASSIQIETIGINPNAPSDAAAVNLYSFNGVRHMTLAEMVMAVCLRQAALIEKQSVIKMNDVNASATWIEALAFVGDKIIERSTLDAEIDLSKTGYIPVRVGMRCTLYDFLVIEAKVEPSKLPGYSKDASGNVTETKEIRYTDDKTKAYGVVKDLMSSAVNLNQRQVIDLQSLLSRRDSTYNTSSSTIKKLGTTMTATAGNF